MSTIGKLTSYLMTSLLALGIMQNVYSQPVEQTIVLEEVQSLANSKDQAVISKKIEGEKRKLQLLATDNPNQRAEAQIILSSSLNAQQVVDLANRYAIEIVSATFRPYDLTTGERFGTGFFGVGARYGPLQERFAWLESRHFQYLSRQGNSSNEDVFLKEKEQLLKSKIPYFELIVYGTYAQLNNISQAPEIKVAVVRKEVSSDEYTNYQRRLQADKAFQRGYSRGDLSRVLKGEVLLEAATPPHFSSP